MTRPASLCAVASLLAMPGLAASPATAAPSGPPTMPLVDATVLYRVAPTGRPTADVRVFFGGGGTLLRIDAPDGRSETVLDGTHRTLLVIIAGQRAFATIPASAPIRDPFLLGGENMAFTASGDTRHLAGLDCAVWEVRTASGSGTACVTANGILLAADGPDGAGGSGRVFALAATVAPLPASVWQPPPGFRRLEGNPVPPAP